MAWASCRGNGDNQARAGEAPKAAQASIARQNAVLDFSRPGKPTDNAFIESFNGKFRAECLNAHWFMSLEDAREKMEAWRRDYNEVRPHSAIGNKPPIELLNRDDAFGSPS